MSNGISFNKTGLQTALENFGTISGEITTQIGEIEAALADIEKYWSGPQHDAASGDKTTAESNMADAKSTLESMKNGVTTLSGNADKVTYG